MNNIQWLFFDVGGVLTDESSFTDWIQEHATERWPWPTAARSIARWP